MKTWMLSLGRHFRQGAAKAYPRIRDFGAVCLAGVTAATIFILEAIGFLVEALGSLPWKEYCTRVSRGLKIPTLGIGTRSLPVMLWKGQGWMAGIAICLALVIGLTWCLVSDPGARSPSPRIAAPAPSAPSDPLIRPTEAQPNRPLNLLLDGPVGDARAYPLEEVPGVVVEVKSRGSARGLGRIQTDHPSVHSIDAMPCAGGTRFVIHTRGESPLHWSLNTEGSVVSLQFVDG